MKTSEALKTALQSHPDLVRIPKAGIPVSAGKGDEKKETVIDDVPLPVSLHAAVQVLGEKKVFRTFVNALVVEIQGEVRPTLKMKDGAGRKKAAYLEEIGL